VAGPLHILKLCVGAESVEDLADWQASQRDRWPSGRAIHVTRMWPKREAELLEGGSLYWVIKGVVLCRQRLIALEEVRGQDGILRCAMHLDAEIARTEAAPRRPFQGWRYLDAAEAPRDLRKGTGPEMALPPSLMAALAEIGVR
jgi:hypothetical protein